MEQHQEQFGVQGLAKGHFDMWDRTMYLAITGWPLYNLSHSHRSSANGAFLPPLSPPLPRRSVEGMGGYGEGNKKPWMDVHISMGRLDEDKMVSGPLMGRFGHGRSVRSQVTVTRIKESKISPLKQQTKAVRGLCRQWNPAGAECRLFRSLSAQTPLWYLRWWRLKFEPLWNRADVSH